MRRALLVSTDDEPTTEIEADLTAAGYEIVRCHAAGAPGFPCAALTEAGCPLGTPSHVDVTVDVRQHPWPHPTLREQGVTCSVRAQVPLVVVGRAHHPYEPWAHITTESREHIATRCDQAIRASTAPLQQAAAHAVRSVLTRDGEARPFVVDVERRHGSLHVRIVAKLPSIIAGMAATRAVAAIRRLDSTASAVDVEIVAPV